MHGTAGGWGLTYLGSFVEPAPGGEETHVVY